MLKVRWVMLMCGLVSNPLWAQSAKNDQLVEGTALVRLSAAGKALAPVHVQWLSSSGETWGRLQQSGDWRPLGTLTQRANQPAVFMHRNGTREPLAETLGMARWGLGALDLRLARSWMQGVAEASVASQVTRDTKGRLAQITQGGWRVRYTHWVWVEGRWRVHRLRIDKGILVIDIEQLSLNHKVVRLSPSHGLLAYIGRSHP